MTRPMSKIMAAGGSWRELAPELLERGIVFNGGVAAGFGARLGSAGAENAYDGGKEREKNYGGDYVVNSFANVGNDAAEEETAEDHGADPKRATSDVVKKVVRVIHFSGASYRRAEGADDGNIPRKDDGFAAIGFVEIVSALEMPALENEGIATAINRVAGLAPDPVADLIACDGAKNDKWKKGPNF